jgi:hypothetical protein
MRNTVTLYVKKNFGGNRFSIWYGGVVLMADLNVLDANSLIDTIIGWYKVLKNIATIAILAH